MTTASKPVGSTLTIFHETVETGCDLKYSLKPLRATRMPRQNATQCLIRNKLDRERTLSWSGSAIESALENLADYSDKLNFVWSGGNNFPTKRGGISFHLGTLDDDSARADGKE